MPRLICGTVWRYCAGTVWQGLYPDSDTNNAQGLFDRDSTWDRTSVTHSAEVKGRTVPSRTWYLELRISSCGCTTCWMFWRSKKWKASPPSKSCHINSTYRRSNMANCHQVWKLVWILVLQNELFKTVLYRLGKTVRFFWYFTVLSKQANISRQLFTNV